jgi:hypothetical protein
VPEINTITTPMTQTLKRTLGPPFTGYVYALAAPTPTGSSTALASPQTSHAVDEPRAFTPTRSAMLHSRHAV